MLGFPFCTPCHTGGLQYCNPTLDTMYPCVDYREGECYSQLYLLWIPGNPSLWIPMPPVSLYFRDVRFTMWTYPSLSLAEICFNTFCIVSHAALCYTHILIILKIINISITQIWVYHAQHKFVICFKNVEI